MRTVYSFVGESKAVNKYTTALETTLKLGKKGGLAKGLGVGCTYGLLFGAWALLLWYASILVFHKVTNGGQAFTTILNVIISGMYASLNPRIPLDRLQTCDSIFFAYVHRLAVICMEISGCVSIISSLLSLSRA